MYNVRPLSSSDASEKVHIRNESSKHAKISTASSPLKRLTVLNLQLSWNPFTNFYFTDDKTFLYFDHCSPPHSHPKNINHPQWKLTVVASMRTQKLFGKNTITNKHSYKLLYQTLLRQFQYNNICYLYLSIPQNQLNAYPGFRTWIKIYNHILSSNVRK